MNQRIEDFIGIYEEALADDYCDRLINYFNLMDLAGFCKSRQEFDPSIQSIYQDDRAVIVQDESVLTLQSAEFINQFNTVLWNTCYPHYTSSFGVLKTSGSHRTNTFKIQKTMPREGYHTWHYESSTLDTSRRLLVWTLYLNDVEEGGETEFLYYSKRIKPKKGTLVIWPASFTHTHRGNPPLSNTKYIATGVVEF